LVDYLSAHKDLLDEDSARRLDSNPLRILDSKNAQTQALLVDAPKMLDYLDDESAADFQALLAMLDAAGQSYVVNQRLVRGLDYYNKTVFEWTTTALGAQGTVCGGGRYDGLVAQFGGRDTPAAGFAIGLERLVLLHEALCQVSDPSVDVYVISADQQAFVHALARVERLREQLPSIAIQMHLGGGSFKSQFKRADKSRARLALVYGQSEVTDDTVTVKPLRGEGEQVTLADTALAQHLIETVGLNRE
jgi:histidyl-tRNA synthetase